MSEAKSEQCATCRFWDSYAEQDDLARNLGDCRRNPPTLSETLVSRCVSPPRYGPDGGDPFDANSLYIASAFPVTHETSWCGQFDWLPRLAPTEMWP